MLIGQMLQRPLNAFFCRQRTEHLIAMVERSLTGLVFVKSETSCLAAEHKPAWVCGGVTSLNCCCCVAHGVTPVLF
jgi:hypothetical protein